MTDILEEVVIDLPLGKVKGCKKLTVYDQSYYSFQGIPYGKPPVGPLRFKAPQPVEPWSPEVIDATREFLVLPVQKNKVTLETEGSEDCLYLNVYAKKLKSDKPLPVMFYIFGGGFFTGEATRGKYSPDYFMAEDVLLITFNYRVCSLGFLRLKDPALKIPGNAGLKDQVLALKWVRQYIKYFNGDPENVTVFGHSAGGMATHYMMITEQTRGLYHKGILMSGNVYNNVAKMYEEGMAYKLAKYHGYTGDDNEAEILKFLMTLTHDKLVQHDLLTPELKAEGLITAFTPCTEAYIDDDCVMPQHPVEMVKSAWSNEIPLMIGSTSLEGLVYYTTYKKETDPSRLILDPSYILPQDLLKSYTKEESERIREKMVNLYLGDDPVGGNWMYPLMRLQSERMFTLGTQRTVLARLHYAATAPTYYYRFDFDSPDFNLYRVRLCGKEVRGVAHADDLSYLYFSKYAWKLDSESENYQMIRRMISIWTQFAKTSNPNCKELNGVTWKPLEPNDPWKVLDISNNVSFIEMPERENLEQWCSLYEKSQLF